MKEKLIEKLKQGDLNHVQIDEWFEHIHNYIEYIYATIEGCIKTENPEMISFILIYAKNYYLKTKDSTATNDIITNGYCEEILKRIIISIKNKPQYKLIIQDLADFPNDTIRLHYCAHIDYRKYLNDSCKRIRKVANILNTFYNQKLKQICYNPQELEQLNFLTSALNYGVIQMKGLYTTNKVDEVTVIKFRSLLFNWNDTSRNPNFVNFDVDILYTIPDKRILATIIHDWIKNGTISFTEEMKPACFDNIQNDLTTELRQIVDAHPSLKRTLY